MKLRAKVFFAKHSRTIEDEINKFLSGIEIKSLNAIETKMITDRENVPSFMVTMFYEV